MRLAARPHRHACVLPSLLALGAMSDHALAIEHYEGLAFAQGSQQLLYREAHWLQEGGGRVVLYLCPGGGPFARKQVHGGGPAPDFEFNDARSGYREGVRTRGAAREVFSRESSATAERRKMIATSEIEVIDAGFDAYIRRQWAAIAPPRQQRVSFLVPSRLQVMDFRIGASVLGDGARSYRLGLDAWYGRALPGIAVTYSAGGARLLEFEGIGNIRDNAGKYPQVRIEFPLARHRSATVAERDQAAARSLVTSCRTS